MAMAAVRRISLGALALTAAFAGASATAQAGTHVFGSDLSHPANMLEHHGADSAFWNVKLAGGQGTKAPSDGQITDIRVKGTVVPDPSGRQNPITMFHFQVLHPQYDGSVKVELSSGAFYTPIGGDTQQINSYQPINLCVHKGDYVDFNDWGGNEWHWGNYDGIPYQVFSRVSDSATNFYSMNNGTNVGSQWQPGATHQGEELLMQTTLKTGPDATDVCPGGYMQHIFKGAEVKDGQSATVRTRLRYTKIRTFCPGPTYGYCIGNVRLRATIGGRDVDLGSQSFKITPATTPSVQVPLSKANVKLLQKAGTTSVKAVVDAHDAPGSDRGANPGIPTQSRTTSSRITLRPDKTLKQTKHKKKRRR
ncbi:MAG: hypothetical protein QOD53_2339 [Thermoleophilaceae bacterium]|jgi:hypothetical protein|nr:hypothetical protein [Thermoleophilaceae bacterium]